MIIDAHAHLLAPEALYAHRSQLIVARGQYGDIYRVRLGEPDLEKSAAQNVSIMDKVGTDIQLLSPRPFMMLSGTNRWPDICSWASDQNDTIARTVRLHPSRFRGVGGLPQQAGRPVETSFDEITRCIEELGFVGILLNPDPGEGSGATPPLGDPYWYPLYERLCALDLPAHVHSGNCCNLRETYDEHFIAEESLAITSIYRSNVFARFPTLRLLISHGGGAIPYQVGRWRSHFELLKQTGQFSPFASFDEVLKTFWYDTVLHNKGSLRLLFDVVGPDRCCFGTERPGSGGGLDPLTGRPLDDLKPVIESLENLTQSERDGVFSGNVRKLFSRLDI